MGHEISLTVIVEDELELVDHLAILLHNGLLLIFSEVVRKEVPEAGGVEVGDGAGRDEPDLLPFSLSPDSEVGEEVVLDADGRVEGDQELGRSV